MKKICSIILGGIILMTIATGCSKSRKEIEVGFESFTSFYPTENLMDFFDKEGFRDSYFTKEDKGVWAITSSFGERKENGVHAKGIRLYFNRNTNEAKGYYFENVYSSEGNTSMKYPVYYNQNGIHLVEDIQDEALKNDILNFKFLVQYLSLNEQYLASLNLERKMYNSEVPIFSLEYNLDEKDKNIQKISKHYPEIKMKQIKMYLRGSDSFEGNSYSAKSINIYFGEEKNISLSENILFTTQKKADEEVY